MGELMWPKAVTPDLRQHHNPKVIIFRHNNDGILLGTKEKEYNAEKTN